MSKYIVTFRLTDSPTYEDRYMALYDFFSNEVSEAFEDETTSTIFCEGLDLPNKLAKADILIKEDEVLFVKVGQSKEIEAAYRVNGNEAKEAQDIINFFN